MKCRTRGSIYKYGEFLVSLIFLDEHRSTMYWRVALIFLTIWCGGSVSICPHDDSSLWRRWSDDSAWPASKPEPSAHVTLTDAVLLDEDVIVDKITINSGGWLIWSPEGDFRLETRYIHINDGGKMHIGNESQGCLFNRKAHITLFGERQDSSADVSMIGQKFIGVESGGTLELHGIAKTSWTKLEATLPKIDNVPGGLIYKHLDSEYSTNGGDRMVVYVMNRTTGERIDYRLFDLADTDLDRATSHRNDLIQLLNDQDASGTGNFVMMASSKNIVATATDPTPLFEAIERFAFGSITNNSRIRDVIHERDTYTLVAQQGNHELSKEALGSYPGVEYQRAVASVLFWDRKLRFTAESNRHAIWGHAYFDFRISTTDASCPTLTMTDDVTSWRPGDRVVVASTDYDWRQAEEATVLECVTCTNYQVRLDLEAQYTHFGEIDDGVDMRAEVSLLTRNILIEGTVERSCAETINGNCNDFAYDTFGGHVMVHHAGFTSVHVEGVEFYHMGQHMIVGRYPFHFHMALDVDEVGGYSNPAYVRGNSFHHCFSRCVTVHGTHGAQVRDNVCYDTLGHAYFLEDGGEKRTVLDGNIALTIRKGKLTTPDERDPTAFWLTCPQTYVRNNVAAGGEGHGYWMIFPKEPLGPSTAYGFMQPDEARHTAFWQFENNVAHSCQRTGLKIDSKLDSNGNIAGGPGYTPKVDPLDPKSADKQVFLEKFTAYKNPDQNVWIRGAEILLTKSSISDSSQGVTLARGSNQVPRLTDSIIIGESANFGEPTMVTIDDNAVLWNKSFPNWWKETPIQGCIFYDGPSYVNNVWLNKFKKTELYESGAFGFKRNLPYPSSPITTVSNVTFGFVDGVDSGNRVYDGNETIFGFSDKDGDRAATFRDGDGSLTGQIPDGATIVKPYRFLTTDDCEFRTNWNMAVCPYKYGKLHVTVRSANDTNSTTHIPFTWPKMIRDDRPDDPEILTAQKGAGFTSILGGDFSYMLSWNNYLPHIFEVSGRGIEKGLHVQLGICLPMDAVFDLYSYSPNWAPTLGDWLEAESWDEFEHENCDGRLYYHDKTVGILFLKFLSRYSRTESDTLDCPRDKCPMVRVTLLSGTDTDIDCHQRAYVNGPYTKTFTSNGNPVTIGDLEATLQPPAGVGAYSTRPFADRISVDGGWGDWDEWSECTLTCGGGVQFRTRPCNNPLPEQSTCSGNRVEQQTCNTDPCPIDGQFSEWSTWFTCTLTHGATCHGFTQRTRECSDPTPNYDGVYCDGATEEIQHCNYCP